MPHKPTDRFTYSRNGNGNADERCLLRVNIPSVVSDAQHTRYKIDVTNLQTRQTWQTSHRYSEFLVLRNELLAHFGKAERKCPGCVNFEKVILLFEFPSKRLFTSKNAVVINYRKTALRAFLALLASHTFTTSPKCPTCSGVPFTAVRDFLTEEITPAGAAAVSPTSSLDSGFGRESVRESIRVKDFTTYVAPAKSAPVSSDGVFVRAGNRGKDRKQDAAPAATTTTETKSILKTGSGSTLAKKTSKKQPAAPPAPTEELPSPASSGSVTKSTASLPASPTRVSKEQAHRDEAASFASFSGDAANEASTSTTPPKTKKPATPSSARAAVSEQARRDDAASFVSFSVESENTTTAHELASPRRSSSSKSARRRSNKKKKRTSSVDSHASVKESQDDEFGSLNLDFLQSVSVGGAKD